MPVSGRSSVKLKVFACGLGTEDRLIAAPNQRAAAEAFGMSLYEFRNYASETGNAEDRALALASPGVLFVRSNRKYGEPWARADAS